jgi:hypothetical protein
MHCWLSSKTFWGQFWYPTMALVVKQPAPCWAVRCSSCRALHAPAMSPHSHAVKHVTHQQQKLCGSWVNTHAAFQHAAVMLDPVRHSSCSALAGLSHCCSLICPRAKQQHGSFDGRSSSRGFALQLCIKRAAALCDSKGSTLAAAGASNLTAASAAAPARNAAAALAAYAVNQAVQAMSC